MDTENLSPLPAGPLEPDPIFRRDKQLYAAGIIGEFPNPRDAQLFAELKRAQREPVEITPGINHPYAVRRMVRVS